MPDLIRTQLGNARARTPIESFPEHMQTMFRGFLARSEANLAQEYEGVTAGGKVVAGLYPLQDTGLSLQPVIAAARAFTALLDDEQRSAVAFDIESEEWRKWHNMHIFIYRHGLCLHDLNDGQRAAALDVMRATLSAAGFENVRNVMKLNEYLAEITGRTQEFNEWYYFMSIFGEPSETEPWGWQLDGHHLIVNCYVHGNQLVLTPFFSGSEPVEALSGTYAGTRTFQAEETTGLALMQALTPEQQARARIGDELPGEVLAIAQIDNLELPFSGIRWDELTPVQQELLLAIIDVYVGRIRPGHDRVRMDEVRAHLDATYFAWIGASDDANPFYYRIYSPVVLIEFDHMPGTVYNNKYPTRAHVHTIVRTPNGNDYGRDLLRQHYAQHDHSHADTPHRRGHHGT